MKVAVVGIGGVGGYFGGLLAKAYAGSRLHEIYFIARGETEKAIRKKGLHLHSSQGEFIIHPTLVTSDATQIEHVDLLICCTKTYSLKESIEQCKPCINPQTLVLPLLNGVDSREVISGILPGNKVLGGCAYLLSKIIAPGIVEQKGNVHKLFFGSSEIAADALINILRFFKEANIEAYLSDDINSVVWEKFVFTAAMATATSYFNQSIGAILSDNSKNALLQSLLHEVKLVADYKKITLPENILQLTLDKMKALPPNATSSMQRDFENKKQTELESLTGYIVREAKYCGVEIPVFGKMYDHLQTMVIPTQATHKLGF